MLLFGAVWVAVIVRWRITHRVPNGTDVALYLVALPIGLLLTFWLVFKVADGARKRREKKAAQATDADESVSAAAPDDPSLDWQMPVLAVDVLMAQGDAPDALFDAALEGKRPDLHPTLRDDQQRPAFAVEVDDVDTEALGDSLPDTAQSWSEARKRTLVLTELLATRLLDEHFESMRLPVDPDAPMTRSKPVVLHLEWLLPAAWSETDRETAGHWLAGRLAEQGWEAPELRIQTRGAQPGASTLKRLDDLNRACNESTLALPHLLLASDSYIDATIVAEWSAAHRLQAADHPEGHIPGEGAAAILVAPPTHPAKPLPVQLGRLFGARRAKAVDQPQRLQSDTLKELADKAAAHSSWDGEGELLLVADTDARSSRSAEVLHLVENLVPEQDPNQSLLPIGLTSGNAGAALMLATVAVAIHAGSENEQPCLVLSHQDPVLRAAMLVTPATQTPADTADSTT